MLSEIKTDLKTNVNIIESSLNFINSNGKINKKNLNNLITEFKIGKTGYVYILDERGIFMAHPTKQGKNYSEEDYIQKIVNSNNKEGILEYTSAATGQDKIVYYKYNEKLKGYIIPGINKTEYTDKILKSVLIETAIIIIIIFLVIVTLLFRMMGKIIISALERFETGLNHFFEYAQGTTDTIKIIEIDRKDEFG